MGGWPWTSHSPTGSGPEGSSPNERGSGRSSASHPLFRSAAKSLPGCKRSRAGWIMARAPLPAYAGDLRRALCRIPCAIFAAPKGRPRPAEAVFRGINRLPNRDMNDTTTSSYRVLARKYRPATFDDLIGQGAMVRTISNGFEAGRIPQAWILTGVRGVGKTTTARILARALNYELPDGSIAAPTVKMPVLGVHCEAIMESRHLDVIEMDAASHNSVDDVRQINDAIRYAPV